MHKTTYSKYLRLDCKCNSKPECISKWGHVSKTLRSWEIFFGFKDKATYYGFPNHLSTLHILNQPSPPHTQIITTWKFNMCFPCLGVSSCVELHVSAIRVGVDRETAWDDFTSGCNRKTRIYFIIFPEEGESYPCPGVRVK